MAEPEVSGSIIRTRDRSSPGGTQPADDDVETEILDRVLISELHVPSEADPGSTIQVTGTFTMDTLFIGKRNVEIRLESPSLSSPIREQLGKQGMGSSGRFSFAVPVPYIPGETMELTVVPRWRANLIGWRDSIAVSEEISVREEPADTGSGSGSGSGSNGSGSGSAGSGSTMFGLSSTELLIAGASVGAILYLSQQSRSGGGGAGGWPAFYQRRQPDRSGR